ncbi:hypothetical protein B0G69_0104 [Paraburkholderia sp. RAU2J]|nr:hypothetical protein B0G69_0104 [Paraburkholderia sp. RAU2J]
MNALANSISNNRAILSLVIYLIECQFFIFDYMNIDRRFEKLSRVST